jgi:hypothetical protein
LRCDGTYEAFSNADNGGNIASTNSSIVHVNNGFANFLSYHL